jgi:CRISPR-associated RAMP protein, cmr6 family
LDVETDYESDGRHLQICICGKPSNRRKTSSGYGYFDTQDPYNLYQKYVDNKKEAALAVAEQAQTAALSPHEQLIAKWLKIIQGEKKYSIGDNEGSQYFKELETDLKQAATDGRLSSQDRQQITEQLALKPVLQKHQPNWLTSKCEKSIKELLKALQNN